MSEFVCEIQHMARIARNRLSDGRDLTEVRGRLTEYAARCGFSEGSSRAVLANSIITITGVALWEYARFKGVPLPSLIKIIPLLPFAKVKGKGSYNVPSDTRHISTTNFPTGQRISRPASGVFIAGDGTQQPTLEATLNHGGPISYHPYEEK